MHKNILLLNIVLVLFATKVSAQVNNNSDIISSGGESACISSIVNGNITTVANGAQVWQFTIRDGGAATPDADALPTIINQLIITQGVSNTVQDWTNIQSIGLFDGSTLIANGTVAATSITFSSLSINIADNDTKTLSVRLTLKTTVSIPSTIDGKAFRFSIIPANITVGAGSSGINSIAPVATTAVGTNVVCVASTKLMFVVQPSNTGLNNTMSPIIKVGAYDNNNNLDLDFTQAVTLQSSGVMVGGTLKNLLSEVLLHSIQLYIQRLVPALFCLHKTAAY